MTTVRFSENSGKGPGRHGPAPERIARVTTLLARFDAASAYTGTKHPSATPKGTVRTISCSPSFEDARGAEALTARLAMIKSTGCPSLNPVPRIRTRPPGCDGEFHVFSETLAFRPIVWTRPGPQPRPLRLKSPGFEAAISMGNGLLVCPPRGTVSLARAKGAALGMRASTRSGAIASTLA